MTAPVLTQFHITVKNFSSTDKQKFINLCAQNTVNPLLIVLEKGNYANQPMFTWVGSSHHLEEAKKSLADC